MPSPTEPRPMATFAQAVRLGSRAGWMPRWASLASTCLSISELILSTSPSATASSYAWPSSVCTAAAAATSSCVRTSMQPSYIAIGWPDNGLRRGCSMAGPQMHDDHEISAHTGPALPAVWPRDQLGGDQLAHVVGRAAQWLGPADRGEPVPELECVVKAGLGSKMVVVLRA